MLHPPPVCATRRGLLRVDSTRPQRQAVAEGKIVWWALTHGYYPGHLLPPMVLPGLSNVGHLDARGEQDWGLEPHRNEGIEICLLETGHMGFTVDGCEHRITGGDITITRPWELHCLGNPNLGTGKLHWLILDVGVRRPNQKWAWPPWVMLSLAEKRELTASVRRLHRHVWKSTPDLRHAFHEVAVCIQRYAAARAITRLKLHVNHLLLGLLEAMRQQRATAADAPSDSQSKVEIFLQELHEEPLCAAQPWTMGRMAACCSMGTTKFSQLCRKATNQSPWDYLIGCRLDWAARQLREFPNRSVLQIALDNGFSTSQYFANRFRRRFHCTPRDYRVQNG